ncbi:MAG: hypothetical protein IT435_11020 [Phycisphaerales bacterium]|nr:hypothetical protein [Phycisphaerales bacterium]
MTSTTQCSILSALEGQKIVVVGGDRREGALTRLRTAFGLADVIHCCTRKGDASPKCFESSLRVSGVVLVVWVLGLSRTHHGEHLHQRCRELGIPYIDTYRIPHPNALLAKIEDLHLTDALETRRAHVLSLSQQRIGGAA